MMKRFLFSLLCCLLLIGGMAFRKPGALLGCLLVLVFSARFLIELVKENQEAFENGRLFNMGHLQRLEQVVETGRQLAASVLFESAGAFDLNRLLFVLDFHFSVSPLPRFSYLYGQSLPGIMNPSIRLSELTNRIQQALNSTFAGQTYWVLADITSHNFYQQKGYHYFDLVEKETHSTNIIAKVAAAAWGTGAQRIREFETVTGQQFRNDIHVLVKVSVSYHQVHGLQVSLLDIDTSYTIGQLEQQKQQVLQRLLLENPDHIRKVGDRYITRNNQLPLPVVIQRIAVVSSGNSAGYQDFRHTLDHNGFGYTFVIEPYFTAVQGEANADLVQQRMVDVYSSGKPYDVVVIIRGGGAQTDFLLFDTYQLGRVVARFPIPVITGIGHQKNETVTDMMAHTPTKTPTKAAELIIAHNKLFEDSIQHLQRDILIRSQQLLAGHNKALAGLHSVMVNQSRTLLAVHKESLLRYRHELQQHAQQLLFGQRQQLAELSAAIAAKPWLVVSNKLNNLSNIVANIRSFSRNLLQHRQAALQQQETLFRVMSPENILRRGFAIVYHDHRIVNDASGIEAGSRIRVQLQDASLEASVTSKINHDERRADI